MKMTTFYYSLIQDMCKIGISSLYKIGEKCTNKINKANLPPISPKDQAVYEDVYNRVNHYLVEEKYFLDKNINIQQVATTCCINKQLIVKSFHFKGNVSFSMYLKQVRVDYACLLLVDLENFTIDAIAEESGFKVTRTFVRSFKQIHNMTPSSYRRIHKPGGFLGAKIVEC